MLDTIDRDLLNIIQDGLPLEGEPYAALGRMVGLTGDEVIARLRLMKEREVIRALGPIIETRRIGMTSTLVAMKVPPGRLEEVAAVVGAYDEVTHSYGRAHAYNLWFTVTAPGEERIAEILDAIAKATGVEDVFPLPALAMYKIKVKFDL